MSEKERNTNEECQPNDPIDSKNRKKDRVAVVAIHGIGEQSAMGTMSHIVKSFLAYEEANGFISPFQNYFSTPTNFSDSFEVQKWIVKENDCYNKINPSESNNDFDKNRPKHDKSLHNGIDCCESQRPLTDFYEMYWAPMMKDSTFAHVFPWMAKLILSRSKPLRVILLTGLLFLLISLVIVLPTLGMLGLALVFPSFFKSLSITPLVNTLPIILSILTFLFLVFFILWVVGILLPRIHNLIKAAVAIFVSAILGSMSVELWRIEGDMDFTFPLFSGLIITFLLFNTTGDFLKKFLADAARYYDPSPTNVENRDRIRQHGVELIENLTSSNKYDRIVILSHSLGSVVGYDVLRLYWAKHCKYYNLENFDNPQVKLGANALDDCFEIKDGKVVTKDLEKYQNLQHEHFKFLKECTPDNSYNLLPWLVSDFITIGSPLSKVRLFSADGEEGKEWERIQERTILTNPPVRDYVTNKYVYEKSKGKYKLHHGALFAFTRWTNIYFPGDWIGGSISESIGKGTRNVELQYDRYVSEEGKKESILATWKKRIFSHTPLTHTKYWTEKIERSKEETDRMTREICGDKYKRDISYGPMDEIYKAMHFDV